ARGCACGSAASQDSSSGVFLEVEHRALAVLGREPGEERDRLAVAPEQTVDRLLLALGRCGLEAGFLELVQRGPDRAVREAVGEEPVPGPAQVRGHAVGQL